MLAFPALFGSQYLFFVKMENLKKLYFFNMPSRKYRWQINHEFKFGFFTLANKNKALISKVRRNYKWSKSKSDALLGFLSRELPAVW